MNCFPSKDIKLERVVRNAFGELLHDREPIQSCMLSIGHESSLYTFKALQERFISLCQLHDSTCRIAKLLNELWSYPILILMAFGFVIVTSQLYFIYCATQINVRNGKFSVPFRCSTPFNLSSAACDPTGFSLRQEVLHLDRLPHLHRWQMRVVDVLQLEDVTGFASHRHLLA